MTSEEAKCLLKLLRASDSELVHKMNPPTLLLEGLIMSFEIIRRAHLDRNNLRLSSSPPAFRLLGRGVF